VIQAGSDVQQIAENFDVVLSIDRALPTRVARPAILMSNTINYQTELWAVQGGPWTRIIAPSLHFKQQLQQIEPSANIAVVGYGLAPDVLRRLLSLPAPLPQGEQIIVRVPHRPDRRKGHIAAIQGLARGGHISKNIQLEIAWLDEVRYAAFRIELEGLAKHLNLVDRISFHPWRNGDARWDGLARSFATLQLGEFEETFGLAAVESILGNRPVIASRQPAITEILGNLDLYVEIADPLDWCSEIKTFWEETPKPTRGFVAATRLPAALSLELMASHYDKILREVLQEGSRYNHRV
jgi:glycosyltransferase involved in cell wall biosynthesis